MLAIAHADHSGSGNRADASFAQCDARYTPRDEPDAPLAFTLPLDGRASGEIAAPDARAARFSCATYKANFPIEDRFDVQTSDRGEVYALVLDGHGGWQVAEYAKQVLVSNVREEVQSLVVPPPRRSSARYANPQDDAALAASEPSAEQIALAIQRGFARTDRALMAKVSDAFQLGFGAVGRCGSCALMVIVQGDMLHVANAGDIRAVLGRKAKTEIAEFEAIALTQDQNAMSPIEQAKLKREHPGEDNVYVCRHPDSCYVKSALQPTRAFGDFALKYSEFNGPAYIDGDRSAGRHIKSPYTPPYITAVPEVKSHALLADDAFVIIGSDGVWDFLTNEEAVEAVRHQIAIGHPDAAAQAVVEKTLQKAAARYGMTYAELLSLPPGTHRRRRHDDTTAVVVMLHH